MCPPVEDRNRREFLAVTYSEVEKSLWSLMSNDWYMMSHPAMANINSSAGYHTRRFVVRYTILKSVKPFLAVMLLMSSFGGWLRHLHSHYPRKAGLAIIQQGWTVTSLAWLIHAVSILLYSRTHISLHLNDLWRFWNLEIVHYSLRAVGSTSWKPAPSESS